MAEKTHSQRDSVNPDYAANSGIHNATPPQKPLKPHSWPELLGLFFIAAITIFVIVSIEKIAIDLGSFGENGNSQTTIQLERLQLRLESVQKIMQLGSKCQQ